MRRKSVLQPRSVHELEALTAGRGRVPGDHQRALLAAFDDLDAERLRARLVALEVEVGHKRRLDRCGDLVQRPVRVLLRQFHPRLVPVQASPAEIDGLEAELQGG